MLLAHRWFVLGLLAFAGSACRASYAPNVRIPVADSVPDVSGTWNTHWGEYVAVVFLKQTEDRVDGTYTTTARPEPGVEGTIEGTLRGQLVGNQLRGTWNEGPQRFGSFRFAFNAEAKAFEGTWGNGESDDTGGMWEGSR